MRQTAGLHPFPLLLSDSAYQTIEGSHESVCILSNEAEIKNLLWENTLQFMQKSVIVSKQKSRPPPWLNLKHKQQCWYPPLFGMYNPLKLHQSGFWLECQTRGYGSQRHPLKWPRSQQCLAKGTQQDCIESPLQSLQVWSECLTVSVLEKIIATSCVSFGTGKMMLQKKL